MVTFMNIGNGYEFIQIGFHEVYRLFVQLSSKYFKANQRTLFIFTIIAYVFLLKIIDLAKSKQHFGPSSAVSTIKNDKIYDKSHNIFIVDLLKCFEMSRARRD